VGARKKERRKRRRRKRGETRPVVFWCKIPCGLIYSALSARRPHVTGSYCRLEVRNVRCPDGHGKSIPGQDSRAHQAVDDHEHPREDVVTSQANVMLLKKTYSSQVACRYLKRSQHSLAHRYLRQAEQSMTHSAPEQVM
jgi:hypothetical protein